MPGLDWLTGSGIEWLPAIGWQQAIEWLTLVVVGFITGVFGVLVGAGGGFILVPILRIFFPGIEPAVVSGTVLALVAANSISGAFAYRYMRVVDKRSAYLFAAAAIPGSVIAPFILKQALAGLPGIYDTAFGLILVVLALRLATQQFDTRRQSRLARARSRRRSFINPQTLRRRHITAATAAARRAWLVIVLARCRMQRPTSMSSLRSYIVLSTSYRESSLIGVISPPVSLS